jgi:uncharacterized coiled-coil protein SlyX
MSDHEHSPSSPTPAQRPDQPQLNVVTKNLSPIKTRLAFPKPRSPRRPKPTPSKTTLSPTNVPSPIIGILEGLSGLSIFDRHPSLLADEAGTLDSADLVSPVTTFQNQAAEFFLGKRKAMENLWETIKNEPEEKKKETVTASLASQADIIEECFKFYLRATNRVRELEAAAAKRAKDDDNEHVKEIEKLTKANRQLDKDREKLGLRVLDMRDRITELEHDIQMKDKILAETPVAASPTSPAGPIDPASLQLWLEGESQFYAAQQANKKPIFDDERPENYTTTSEGAGADDDEPQTPTEEKRARLRRKFHGVDVPPEIVDMLHKMDAEVLTKHSQVVKQKEDSILDLKQRVKALTEQLDHERYEHGLLAEEYERFTGEPVSLAFYQTAKNTSPLGELYNTIQQLREELTVSEANLTKANAQESKERQLRGTISQLETELSNLKAQPRDDTSQLEKDLARLKDELSVAKDELEKNKIDLPKYTRDEIDRLHEQVKEQSQYIQKKNKPWGQAADNEKKLKKQIRYLQTELRTERDLSQDKVNQLVQRIEELEKLEDHTTEFEKQIKDLEEQLKQQTERATQFELAAKEDRLHFLAATGKLEDQEALKAQLAEAEAQLADTETALHLAQTERDTILTQISELQMKEERVSILLESTEEDLERERGKATQFTDRIQELELAEEIHKQILEETTADLELEREKLADVIHRIEELEDVITEQSEYIEDQRQRIEELEVDITWTTNDLAKARDALLEERGQEASVTIAGLEAIIIDLRFQIDTHRTTISNLLKLLEEKENEAQDSRSVDEQPPQSQPPPQTQSPPTQSTSQVLHQHTRACFCTLLDWFVPGILDRDLDPHEPCTLCCTCGYEAGDGSDAGSFVHLPDLPEAYRSEPQNVPGSETEDHIIPGGYIDDDGIFHDPPVEPQIVPGSWEDDQEDADGFESRRHYVRYYDDDWR